jgi:microcystin degradation protein MlrC
MRRIAIAGFSHETNTFSPFPTTYEDFATRTGPFTGIVGTEEILPLKGQRFNAAALGFINTVEGEGYETVFILMTGTNPSNQVSKDAFDRIVELIVDGIAAQGHFDAVFLDLHGAMVYEGYHDGETEIVRRIKSALNGIPVFATFDLHGNIHRMCFEDAAGLVGCRTYPHIDMYETGERCAYLMMHYFSGETLYKSFRRIPFIPVLSRMSTFTEPCKSIYAAIDDVEKNAQVVSATIMEGFPPSDTEHTGPTVFAYASTQEAADWAAEQLYEAFLSRESQFKSDLPGAAEGVHEAIELASWNEKPVIISDILDNPGGGSSSDTVWILEELIKQNAPETALGLLFDVEAARAAHQAGEGAQISIDLGGKLTPGHKPFHGTFSVEKLFEGVFAGTGPLAKGIPFDLGKMAQLKIGNVRIVAASQRVQAADQSIFRMVGIEPAEMKILVLKSSNHFRADFEPIASKILYAAAPSAMVENPADVDYHNLADGIRLGGNGPVFRRQKGNGECPE